MVHLRDCGLRILSGRQSASLRRRAARPARVPPGPRRIGATRVGDPMGAWFIPPPRRAARRASANKCVRRPIFASAPCPVVRSADRRSGRSTPNAARSAAGHPARSSEWRDRIQAPPPALRHPRAARIFGNATCQRDATRLDAPSLEAGFCRSLKHCPRWRPNRWSRVVHKRGTRLAPGSVPPGCHVGAQAPVTSNLRHRGIKAPPSGSRSCPTLAMCPRVGHMRDIRRCGRVAEGGGLLNRYRVVKPYRGFESLRLRQ
jgi:hypothetical protein